MALVFPQQLQPPAPVIPGLDAGDATPGVPQAITAQFTSSLQLDEEQERNFATESILRTNELKLEMGLTATNDVMPNSWMWLRQCHEQYYLGDLSWRLAFGGIFAKCNITLGSGLRHVRYLSSRLQDDLLGTSPFFAALAAKKSKEALAKQVEAYVQGAIERSNVRASLRESQKIALYRNECVVKTGYLSDSTPYIGEATVLVDMKTQQPITTPAKQLFIYEDDQVTADPNNPGVVMLDSDPSFKMADHPTEGIVTIWQDPTQPQTEPQLGSYQKILNLPQVLVRKEGVYADPLDHRVFLCPLKVKSIHEADTCVHLYLETPSRLQKIYGGIDCSQKYFASWNSPGQDKPKYEQGEQSQPNTAVFQQIIVAEIYRRCDPDKTGEDKEILLVMDWTNQKSIYYNYLANHMAKRPFESISGVEKIPGRWYGRGIYGMLDSHLFYEDVEASRSFFKNSQDATIQFGYKDAMDDWRNGDEPMVGDGRTNWLRPDWNQDGKIKSPIWRENLASNFAPDEKLMNIMRQSADSLVGAISTASANESDFNQSKTATGNQLVQQAADIITRACEQDQTESINAVLAQVVDIALEHMDETVLIADPDTQLVATVNRNEARGLDKDVRLLLTRSKSALLLTTSAQAVGIGKDYFVLMQQNMPAAQKLRPLFLSQLKSLEVDDADDVLPEITDDMVQQWTQAQSQAQKPQPPAKSISANFKDLPPSVQDQVLQSEGYTPPTPQERLQALTSMSTPSQTQQSASPSHNLNGRLS